MSRRGGIGFHGLAACLFLLTAWTARGEHELNSRFGFRAALPDDWLVGAAALEAPGWGEMDDARRAELLAALTPEDGEVIMTGSPEAGFNHIEIAEEELNLLNYPREVVLERFGAVFAPWPQAQLELREVAGAPWLEACLPSKTDDSVLVIAYWQPEAERVVVFNFIATGGEDGGRYRAWRDFTATITVNPNQESDL